MSAIEIGRAPARPWWPRLPRRFSAQAIIYVLLVLLVANLVLVPLGMVIATSMNVGPITTPGEVGFTLSNYTRAWTSPTTHGVIWNTLVFAVISTFISVTVGVFFA